jgi:hypothetical protein
VNAMSDDEREAMIEANTEATLESLAALCQGSPSKEELSHLPVRLLNAFATFLFDAVAEMRPTPPASATRLSLVPPTTA